MAGLEDYARARAAVGADKPTEKARTNALMAPPRRSLSLAFVRKSPASSVRAICPVVLTRTLRTKCPAYVACVSCRPTVLSARINSTAARRASAFSEVY